MHNGIVEMAFRRRRLTRLFFAHLGFFLSQASNGDQFGSIALRSSTIGSTAEKNKRSGVDDTRLVLALADLAISANFPCKAYTKASTVYIVAAAAAVGSLAACDIARFCFVMVRPGLTYTSHRGV